jgi:FdhE protein
MPYVDVAVPPRAARAASAAARWDRLEVARPDLRPAVALQRRLIGLVVQLTETVEQARLPRLSLPPRYLAAKLGRGIPALSGEPIPLPVVALRPALLHLCTELAQGGAGDAAVHIRDAVESGGLDAASLLTASLAREQHAIRTAAAHKGLAADLLWLVAELAVSPFVYVLERSLFAGERQQLLLGEALARWERGYCPACGSWPALAEANGDRRVLRCSFCAAAWEPATHACIYCRDSGEAFTTRAIGAPDRRLELCTACSGYLKIVDVAGFCPFPLIAIADLETMELDVAAMQEGYRRPALPEFQTRR